MLKDKFFYNKTSFILPTFKTVIIFSNFTIERYKSIEIYLKDQLPTTYSKLFLKKIDFKLRFDSTTVIVLRIIHENKNYYDLIINNLKTVMSFILKFGRKIVVLYCSSSSFS